MVSLINDHIYDEYLEKKKTARMNEWMNEWTFCLVLMNKIEMTNETIIVEWMPHLSHR